MYFLPSAQSVPTVSKPPPRPLDAGRHADVVGGHAHVDQPCLIADQDASLIQCLPPDPENERGLWLLVHEHTRELPHVRATLDFLGTSLSRLCSQKSLAGSGRLEENKTQIQTSGASFWLPRLLPPFSFAAEKGAKPRPGPLLCQLSKRMIRRQSCYQPINGLSAA